MESVQKGVGRFLTIKLPPSHSTSKESPVAFPKPSGWPIFWSGSSRGEAAAAPARVVRRCPPPILSMCPFTTALQCRPIVPPELPKTPPGSWMEGGGTTTCPPDHLGPPVGAPAELLRATSVGRHPPAGHQLRTEEAEHTTTRERFLTKFLQRPRDFYGEKIK